MLDMMNRLKFISRKMGYGSVYAYLVDCGAFSPMSIEEMTQIADVEYDVDLSHITLVYHNGILFFNDCETCCYADTVRFLSLDQKSVDVYEFFKNNPETHELLLFSNLFFSYVTIKRK